MTTFEDFHKALIADERWHETMKMIHKYKPFDEVCKLVYGSAMSEGTLEGTDIGEHRKHVHNKLAKTPVKVATNTVQLQQPEEKHEKVEVKVYATDDQREYWLNKLQEQIKEIQVKPVARMSHKEIAEQGDWIPKKKHVPTDAGYYYEHTKLLHTCRVKTMKERYPHLSEEEIEDYIKKNFDEV